MKKYTKIIFILFIIILVHTNIFAVPPDVETVILSNLRVRETIYNIPYVDKFAPGDSIDSLVSIKNTSNKSISIYFLGAKDFISFVDMEYITFAMYFNGKLYQKGNLEELKGKTLYTLAPNEEVTLIMRTTMNIRAGNEYQAKEIFLKWKLGIIGFVLEKGDEPTPQSGQNEEIYNPILETPDSTSKQDELQDKVYKDIDELNKDTESDNILDDILTSLYSLTNYSTYAIVTLLILAAIFGITIIGKGIIILIAWFKNTLIYIKLPKTFHEEFDEPRYKLIKKKYICKLTKRRKEKQIDITDYVEDYIKDSGEEYRIEKFKIVFKKQLSKRLCKSKIIIKYKEEEFILNAKYNKKPIEIYIYIWHGKKNKKNAKIKFVLLGKDVRGYEKVSKNIK